MSQYLNGRAALADARLRLDALPVSEGALLLEGRDDLITFADRVRSLQAVITCGNKRKLLEAFQSSNASDRSRMLFVADCDYDVPAGRVSPSSGLVLSRHTDREADLVALGLVRGVVLRAVPRARNSDSTVVAITEDVTEKAIQLAEGAGRLRHVSAVDALGLAFDGLELRRFRDKDSGQVRLARLAESVCQRSPTNAISASELGARAEQAPGGIEVCSGKDLVDAVIAVIHHDYNISLRDLEFVPEVFRTIDGALFSKWEVAQRVKRWEHATGRRILR